MQSSTLLKVTVQISALTVSSGRSAALSSEVLRRRLSLPASSYSAASLEYAHTQCFGVSCMQGCSTAEEYAYRIMLEISTEHRAVPHCWRTSVAANLTGP